MADPVDKVPMAVIDKTMPQDNWIFRAISREDNVMFIYGRDTLLNARRVARELARNKNYLVEEPIRKEDRTWRI